MIVPNYPLLSLKLTTFNMINPSSGKLLTLTIDNQQQDKPEGIKILEAIKEMKLEFKDWDFQNC